MKEVMQFLNEMMVIDDSDFLWDAVNYTRGKCFEQVRYLGRRNAITLIRNSGHSFDDKDLSGSIIVEADIRSCNLNKTKLNNCVMERSDY